MNLPNTGGIGGGFISSEITQSMLKHQKFRFAPLEGQGNFRTLVVLGHVSRLVITSTRK